MAAAVGLAACDPSEPTSTGQPPVATSHQVQVAIAGDGVGTVSVGSTTLTCATGSATCAAPVPSGTMLSLTATPAAGSTFASWTGAAGCGTASTCAIRVDAPQALTATFVRTAPATHALTVATAGTGAGSVASSPAGIACVRAAGGVQSGACEAPFTAASTVTLTATPTVGSTFLGWSGTGVIACAGTGPCAVTLSAAQTVTATFAPSAPVTTTLTVATAGGGSGSVASAPAGIACARATDGTQGGACAATFTVGSAVTLTASPTAGSAFVGWSGTGAAGCTGTGPCTVAIAEGRTVVATFAPPPPTLHALTVVFAGLGEGSVASTPTGIQCVRTGGGQTGDCGTSVVSGTTVTLTATPAAGYVFVGWTGAGCSGTGPCTVAVQQAATVTATFGAARQTLTVATAGLGGGTVTSTPDGIGCARTPSVQGGTQSGSCAAAFDAGRTVTLAAVPAAGSTFQGWSGGGCSGTGSCVLTMQAAQGVTATFGVAAVTTPPVPSPTLFTLFVATAGTGDGSVSSAPAGVSCSRSSGGQGGACAVNFASGTAVTLTATAAAGSTFAGWSGACSGTGPCVLGMSGVQSVTATFVSTPVQPPPMTLTVATAGAGGGSVSSAPAGITCTRAGGAQSGTCAASVAAGTNVTLTAAPAAGSTFAGWSGGGCSGTGSCVVALSAAQTVTATFGVLPPQAALSLTLTGTGGGTIAWSAPPAGSCARTALSGANTSCTPSFDVGTTVTLTATPAAGSYLAGWFGGCFGNLPTCTVSMSAAGSVTASFQYDVSAPTLTVSGVTNGAAYVTHPNITLAYADDMGFGAVPLRITWSRLTPANALHCFAGLDLNNAALFSTLTAATCSARSIVGVGAITAAGLPAGTYTLTIQAVDMAGNASTPVTRTYTVGM